MLDPSSPYWLASVLGLNAAGNTGSNRTSLPPLVINSMDYFTDPDYLRPKYEKDNVNVQCLPTTQQLTTGVQDEFLQPVIGEMPDSSLAPESVIQLSCEPKTSDDVQNEKKTKFRIVKWQRDLLESQYAVTKLPTKANQQQLANQLNISSAQVKVWFKHRRQKERRASDSNKVLENSQLNHFPLSTALTNSSQILSNNQHLHSSSNVSTPHYYSSSTSTSHQSSLSPQSNTPSYGPIEFFNIQTQSQKKRIEERLGTLTEHDENDAI